VRRDLYEERDTDPLVHGGTVKAHLLDELRDQPERFEFCELVRLLEHALGVEVSTSGPGDAEGRLRFAHSPDLAFPTTDVAWTNVDGASVEVGTTFLGLLGTASPLSAEWTEQVLHDDDEARLRSFYDVFHHRALSLLVAAWKVHALEGGFDLRGEDPLSRRLRSLAGVDGWIDSGDEALPPMAAVGLADYQRGQPQAIDVGSAEGLLRRLYPTWNVRLQAGVPRFIAFTDRERARLGHQRNALGGSLVYGDGRDEAQTLLCIHVGPVDLETYERLMPGGDSYRELERLARRLFAGALDVELEVQVAPGAAPMCVLGRPAGARLGVDARVAEDREASVRARVRLLQGASAARRAFV
jgi:type VI secretion system protein ImpH